MKDIDFDELDRAVSSLMKTVPEGGAPAVPADTTRVVELGEKSSSSTPFFAQTLGDDIILPVSAPPLTTSEDAELSSSEVVIEQTMEDNSPVAAPLVPRGRFMDVVRPSSRDVRKPFANGAISRQGVTLEPTNIIQPSENAPEEMSLTETEAVVDQVEQDTFADTYEAFSQNSMEEASEETMPSSDDSLINVETAEDTLPLSSPFLPDTKVEKRPLGRPVDPAPAVDLGAELAEQRVDNAEEPYNVPDDASSPDNDAQLPEQPLPAELGSELLSIETSTDNLPNESRPSIQPQPESMKPTLSNPSTVARAMAATSIPQQYKVQSNKDEVEPTGAIYDSQPLAHPAKAKPGWLWIVAIIVILLLGAGSGAAVYYLGLL